MYWIWKIDITKQVREIIYTKFREMYWYLKNLHNETISRHFAKFREIKYNEISRNFAKFREIKITYVVNSYFTK
jgi:hypothetical protein